MSYEIKEKEILAIKAKVNMLSKFLQSNNTNVDSEKISDLLFYFNKLAKNSQIFNEKLDKDFIKWGLSKKDVKICKNFNSLSGEEKSNLLKQEKFCAKIIFYANLLKSNFLIESDCENKFISAIYCCGINNMEKYKKHLDKRPKRYQLYREAWLRKTYNETGLEDASEKVKFDRYYLEHMKRNKLR